MIKDHPFEVSPVVHQPVEIEEPLIYDVLIGGALIFDDHWASVLVQTECINYSSVRRVELGSEETDAKKRFQIPLEEGLERLLNGLGGAKKRIHLTVANVERTFPPYCSCRPGPPARG